MGSMDGASPIRSYGRKEWGDLPGEAGHLLDPKGRSAAVTIPHCISLGSSPWTASPMRCFQKRRCGCVWSFSDRHAEKASGPWAPLTRRVLGGLKRAVDTAPSTILVELHKARERLWQCCPRELCTVISMFSVSCPAPKPLDTASPRAWERGRVPLWDRICNVD